MFSFYSKENNFNIFKSEQFQNSQDVYQEIIYYLDQDSDK